MTNWKYSQVVDAIGIRLILLLLCVLAKLVPLAYGIKKLQITCVVEDDKVVI